MAAAESPRGYLIITEPNKLVAEVYDRMPVLLAEKDFEPWLNGSAGIGRRCAATLAGVETSEQFKGAG